MNNLKRVLSLALASVMVLGMMVVGASAADYADGDKITHQDAVETLSALGIVNGKDGNNFDPTGTLTRAEAATMLSKIHNKGRDINYGTKTEPSFTDIGGKWFEKYVEYAYAFGIVKGNGDGTFNPDGTLRTVELVRMVLNMMGYANEGIGSSWEIETTVLAQEKGLFESLASYMPTEEINRDDAAQVIATALNKPMAGADTTTTWTVTGKKGVESVTANNFVSSTEAYMYASLNGLTDVTVTSVTPAPESLGTKYLSLKQVTGHIVEAKKVTDGYTVKLDDANATVFTKLSTDYTDMLGRQVKVLYKANDSVYGISTIGSVVATIDGSEWNADQLLAADKRAHNLETGAVFFENGEKKAQASVTIGAGSVVELINESGDAKIEAVRVVNKSVATVGADPKLSTDGKKVTIKNVVDTATEIEKVVGYEDLKEDDVVLYVTINGITTIEKAEKVTGKITAANSTKTEYTMNGGKLTYSGLAGTTAAKVEKDSKTDFENEYDFFLDNGGHIVALAMAGVAPAAPVYKYAVTEDFGLITTGQQGAIGAETSTTYQIKMFFADTGKSEIVELVKYTSGSNVYFAVPKTGETGLSTVINTDKNGTLQTTNKGKLVKYSEADGKYTVEEVGETPTSGDIKGGKPGFNGTLVANANTVFIVKSGSGTSEKTQVITGYANLPSATNKTSATPAGPNNAATNIQYVKKDGFVTYAYVVVPNFDSVTTKETAYFIKNAGATETANGYTVKAIVDGELKDLTIKAAAYDTTMQALTGLAEVTYDADGKVTAATAIEDSGLATAGWAKAEKVEMLGSFVKSGNNVYEVASGVQIFKVEDNKATAVEVSKLGDAIKDTSKWHTALINKDAGENGITVMIITSADTEVTLAKKALIAKTNQVFTADTLVTANCGFTASDVGTVLLGVDGYANEALSNIVIIRFTGVVGKEYTLKVVDSSDNEVTELAGTSDPLTSVNGIFYFDKTNAEYGLTSGTYTVTVTEKDGTTNLITGNKTFTVPVGG